jgi:phosphinothricin acetyltransferase
MNIRDAVETDLPAIVEIYNAAIPQRMATADLELVSVKSRSSWFYEHIPLKRPIWVMEIDQITGWLSFQSFYGRPAYHATAEISIYVAPNYQRCGVGRQLLTQAISHSPSFGLKTLLGFIFAHNQPSLQLFESLGFQRWGLLPQVAELDGIERDLLIMGYRII